MKKLFTLFLALFLLAACSGGVSDNTTAKLPNIPKRPSIPTADELKASVLDADKTQKVDISDILDEIDQEIQGDSITSEDIERGWYLGGKDDKKFGTPDTWTWITDQFDSRWVSQSVLEEVQAGKLEELCSLTGGSYEKREGDENLKCYCPEGSDFEEKEGCLLLKDGDFVSISTEEIRQGWYAGYPYEKKRGTPAHWQWIKVGDSGRWQNVR